MEEDVARTRGDREKKKNDGVGGRRKKSWNNIFESLGSGVISYMDGELVIGRNDSVIGPREEDNSHRCW